MAPINSVLGLLALINSALGLLALINSELGLLALINSELGWLAGRQGTCGASAWGASVLMASVNEAMVISKNYLPGKEARKAGNKNN